MSLFHGGVLVVSLTNVRIDSYTFFPSSIGRPQLRVATEACAAVAVRLKQGIGHGSGLHPHEHHLS